MTDLPDPNTWQSYQTPDDSDVPSFRFSQFFNETYQNVTPKLAGAWLKVLDTDTIKDFCETFLAIDKAGVNDNG